MPFGNKRRNVKVFLIYRVLLCSFEVGLENSRRASDVSSGRIIRKDDIKIDCIVPSSFICPYCYLRVQIFYTISTSSLFRAKESKKCVYCKFFFCKISYWKEILCSRKMQFVMINLLFSCVTAYILFSFLILNPIFRRKLQRKE